jgi:hypothetical protein
MAAAQNDAMNRLKVTETLKSQTCKLTRPHIYHLAALQD